MSQIKRPEFQKTGDTACQRNIKLVSNKYMVSLQSKKDSIIFWMSIGFLYLFFFTGNLGNCTSMMKDWGSFAENSKLTYHTDTPKTFCGKLCQ